jgi:hypothetical protein
MPRRSGLSSLLPFGDEPAGHVVDRAGVQLELCNEIDRVATDLFGDEQAIGARR